MRIRRAMSSATKSSTNTGCRNERAAKSSRELSRFEKVTALPLLEQVDFSTVHQLFKTLVHTHTAGSSDALLETHKPCKAAAQTLEQSLHIKGKRTHSRRRTYALVLAYEGWKLNSWGIQPGEETPLSAQGALERALLSTLGSKPKKLSPCGRTDKGVSASCQVCSFQSSSEHVDKETLRHAVRESSDGAASLVDLTETVAAFHAQFQAHWRRYLYILPLTQQLREQVDITQISASVNALEGNRLDMTAFARDTPRGKATQCRFYRARAGCLHVAGVGECIVFEMVCDRFLRRLARVLVSTCINEAIEGVIHHNKLLQIARSQQRTQTAVPAPADGLILTGAAFTSEAEPEVALPIAQCVEAY